VSSFLTTFNTNCHLSFHRVCCLHCNNKIISMNHVRDISVASWCRQLCTMSRAITVCIPTVRKQWTWPKSVLSHTCAAEGHVWWTEGQGSKLQQLRQWWRRRRHRYDHLTNHYNKCTDIQDRFGYWWMCCNIFLLSTDATITTLVTATTLSRPLWLLMNVVTCNSAFILLYWSGLVTYLFKF